MPDFSAVFIKLTAMLKEHHATRHADLLMLQHASISSPIPLPSPQSFAADACVASTHAGNDSYKHCLITVCGVAVKAYLSEEARLSEVGDPLWGCLAFRQAELHFQHGMREARDVCAWNGLIGIPIPPALTQNEMCVMTQD